MIGRYWRRLLEMAGMGRKPDNDERVPEMPKAPDLLTLVIHPEQASRLRHDPAFLPVSQYRGDALLYEIEEDEVGRYMPAHKQSCPDHYAYRIIAPRQIGRMVSPVAA